MLLMKYLNTHTKQLADLSSPLQCNCIVWIFTPLIKKSSTHECRQITETVLWAKATNGPKVLVPTWYFIGILQIPMAEGSACSHYCWQSFKSPPKVLHLPWNCHSTQILVSHQRQKRAFYLPGLCIVLPLESASGHVVLWAWLLCLALYQPEVVMKLSNLAMCTSPYPTDQWLNWIVFLIVHVHNQGDAQKTTQKVKTWFEAPASSMENTSEDTPHLPLSLSKNNAFSCRFL